MSYDAILITSFGGPENPGEVVPFLENVLRGRNVPRERLLAVAEHYLHFGGKSPLNDQNRALVAELSGRLALEGPRLPVYWGNRNWHPFLTETLMEMKRAGIQRALAFVTSAFGSYSGCRQYLEDIQRARTEVGAGAPEIEKLRLFYNHPLLIEIFTDSLRLALDRLPANERGRAAVLFSAHSIPVSMAETSPYVGQLRETMRLILAALRRHHGPTELVYQSRSGPPSQPWLEPDVGARLEELHREGTSAAVVVPLGFLSDHMEVLYDLDTAAQDQCHSLGMKMVRAATPANDHRFTALLHELIREKTEGLPPRALGRQGVPPSICPADCCHPIRPAAHKKGRKPEGTRA